MHCFRHFSFRFAAIAAVWAVVWAVFPSCDSFIYDDEGDCSVHYRVRFRYDMNMKYADAFAHEVSTVTLWLLDSGGNIVHEQTESGEALAAEDYAMEVDVEPGTYNLLVWCGTADRGSFSVAPALKGTGLTCRLATHRAANGSAFIDTDIDRLFHGYLPAQVFPDTEGTHIYTVPLVKNTNSVRVVLQHLSGEKVDKDKFLFTVTDDNGYMDWDNSLIPDADITYYAWRTDAGEAVFEGSDGGQTSSAAFSAAVAEFTVARLVKGHQPRLTVTDIVKGRKVFSIPLIDYALLVKGYYNRAMDDQEYLDRQDEYNMTFFLDEDDRWVDSFIYINSWKVVLQDSDLD